MALLVLETFRLQPRHADRAGAVRAGHDYERRLHANAHGAGGYVGHASFHFEAPDRLVVVYPWSDRAALQALLASEAPLLAGFLAEFCVSGREVRCLETLPVDPS